MTVSYIWHWHDNHHGLLILWTVMLEADLFVFLLSSVICCELLFCANFIFLYKFKEHYHILFQVSWDLGRRHPCEPETIRLWFWLNLFGNSIVFVIICIFRLESRLEKNLSEPAELYSVTVCIWLRWTSPPYLYKKMSLYSLFIHFWWLNKDTAKLHLHFECLNFNL